MTSIDDVARASGVSTATVSRALRGLPNVSPATRETVLATAEELGYVASSSASGLATGRTLAMGVVVPNVSRWFYSTVLEGIDSELRRVGYDTILFNLGLKGEDRERVFHRSILRKRTDAVIALCLDFTPSEREQLASLGHPTIVVGGPVTGLRHLGIDELAVARTATEHLIALGHRAIGHLGGATEHGLNKRVPERRRRGYELAMAAARLAVRPEWEESGEFTIASGREVALRMLRRTPRPTALFAASDEMAIGAILAARELGIDVPGELSVIGIDDHPLAATFGLTTIAQDAFGQGCLAARLMLDELAGSPPHAGSGRYPTALIERSSTSAR
ncbi:LacI family DNA-binding transcriptional regulator [Gryllotalpicola protaetiae]|uniref:LacI family transcriptional regulator n=1 Tax=Gryllotalpicola protaetiae TaxID=2419771 RepID=A0A387BSV0_9MICO|nr:LacI family DNA-binding transcriptional regulator [Gryllotalpicola protaetiae]AYG04027.1 LacI family transcriptional regulator [Gryllotalpicola protaetiae]